ncbi:MAG TPA: SHOCT domain-containing protein [Solirubrobacteraceae bacterium]|nr:SHOCT domain-containing protein [Solirubrobacteraceae bacterium]
MTLAFLVVAVVLAGLLAAAIYVGVRAGLGWRRDDDAHQTLSRRFAAGEIDDDEYHERLAALRSAESGGQRV